MSDGEDQGGAGVADRVAPSFLVLSHGRLRGGTSVFGPTDNLVEHLVAEGYPTDVVFHPLDNREPTIHRTYRAGEPPREASYRVRGRPGELLANVRLIRRLQPEVVVAVDPLNHLAVWAAARLGRSPLAVYFTADYTRRRFRDPARNAVYHALDRLALRSADVMWSVSRPIHDLRAAQGVAAGDRFLVPNAPPFDPGAVVPWAERDPDSLVLVAMLDPLVDWRLLLDALELLARRRPGVRLRLVGDGPEGDRLRAEVGARGLGGAVSFEGLTPHDTALELVARSRLGLALYSGVASWNVYGDSLKVREYLSRGVPVISTATHPLAQELEDRGAGIVVAEAGELAAAAERLLSSEAGERAAAAAVELAREADRTTVLRHAIDDLRRRLGERAARRP